MHVFIVYIHPHSGSFTACIRDAFISGLSGARHTWEISDLYAQNSVPT
ncbi:MAG: NAD(P)H-dependent oxidoreductase [Methanocalculaceae archaeon]|nr:NAD(P)H-dependent oxidoreductase [Methanocalculaceae archaeon]